MRQASRSQTCQTQKWVGCVGVGQSARLTRPFLFARPYSPPVRRSSHSLTRRGNRGLVGRAFRRPEAGVAGGAVGGFQVLGGERSQRDAEELEAGFHLRL